jgi:tetratricopeptide (TPR) repeat protein
MFMVKVLILILLISFGTFVLLGQTSQVAQDYLIRSQSYFQKGEIELALKEIDKALELNPNYVDAFFLRAIINNKRKDMEGVLADYNKIIELAPTTSRIEVVYTNRSSIYLHKGEIDKALHDLDKAVSINPKVAEIYIARAVARLQKRELDGALADYEKSIELNPTISAAFLGRAYFRYQKGDFDRALADYNKAIELRPNYGDLYVSRGIVHGLKNDFTAAVADIKKGAALNPKSISDESRGNFNSSFKELNQFISKNPKIAQAYILRGILRKFQVKEKEAESDFNEGLKLAPELKAEIKIIVEELKSSNGSKN